MTTGVSTKPTIGGLQITIRRSDAAPVHGAVATELFEAVGAATGSDMVRRDPLRASAVQAGAPDAVRDAETREAIFRAIEWSRRAARSPNVPAAVARRLKAYERPAHEDPHGDEPHADIQV